MRPLWKALELELSSVFCEPRVMLRGNVTFGFNLKTKLDNSDLATDKWSLA